MADALVRKRISTVTYIAPDENAAEARKDYLSLRCMLTSTRVGCLPGKR